jgi:hypothetical protein
VADPTHGDFGSVTLPELKKTHRSTSFPRYPYALGLTFVLQLYFRHKSQHRLHPAGLINMALFLSIPFLLIFLFSPLIESKTVTIESDRDLAKQNVCVSRCIAYPGRLRDGIGCGQTALEECFCRSGQETAASSVLVDCIVSTYHCTQTSDMSAAMSIYNRYCEAVRATEPVSVLATPTTTPSSITTTTSLTEVSSTRSASQTDLCE